MSKTVLALTLPFVLFASGCDRHSSVSVPVVESTDTKIVETPESKFAETIKRAESGDASAQADVYEMYVRGTGVEKSSENGLPWLMKAVEKNHPKAVFLLSLRAGSDDKRRMELLNKAHELGSVDATYDLALTYKYGYYSKEDKKLAVKFAELAAEKNHPASLDLLASLYDEGWGVPQREDKAIKLWLRGAELGDANSLYRVGMAQFNGKGLPVNFEQAAENIKKAAVLGNVRAQFYLGTFYDTGTGVARDKVLSYAWFNIASANPVMKHLPLPAEKFRDTLSLSSDELKEAQQLSSAWKRGEPIVRTGSSSNSSKQIVVRYGTAFFVSDQGHAVTNNHVTEKCSNVRIKTSSLTGSVVASDKSNDLSLLKFDLQATKHVRFGSSRDLNEGASVVVFGFPLSEVLPSSGNVTNGIVSSVSGLANNSSQFQITAPVQPGSSGSPVMDRKGRVIGIVSQKLSDAKVMNVTGNVAQNVGFSVKSDVILELLRQNKVPVSGKDFFDFFERSTESIVEDAKVWTFVVECVR